MTSLHADDAFLNYYQFSHDPFTPRVPGFKFYPAQRKSVLGQLHHLARYDQALLLVAGPKGSGKTLLRQALVASTNKQSVQSLVLSGRECSTADGVLVQIARGLDATSSSSSAILKRAGQLALTGQEEYLLVDDASLLDDSALQALLELAAGNGEGRLHVFLFAEVDLADRLISLSGGEEGFRTIELQPYAEVETREYVAQRLEGAGQSIDLLTTDQIDDIHEQSGGWPGAINLIARETLVDAMLADRGEKASGGFSIRLPRKHVLALMVVCIAVLAAWFFSSEKPVISPESHLGAESGAPVERKGSDSAVEFSGSGAPLPQTVQPVMREPLAQASGGADAEESAEVLTGESNAGDIAAPSRVDAVGSVPLPLPAQPSAIAQTPDVEPVTTVPAVQPASASVDSGALATAKDAQISTALPVPKPAAAVQPKPVAIAAVTSPAGADWYRAQIPARFALQLLGTRSESNAKAFVKQNGSEYRYFMKMHQGAPLYVITYGVFSSRAAADAALKTLPAKIQAGKPWPKTFASIQKEMFKAP